MPMPPAPPLLSALACVTVSCPEPARLVALLCDAVGWEVLAKAPLDGATEHRWGIAAGIAGPYQWVLRAPGATRGMIRVVQGPDRYPARPIGARWSGCVIIVMKDIDGLHDRLAGRRDFRVISPLHDVDFTHAGSNIHRVFTGRMPGGTHIVLTMAVTMPKGWFFPSAASPVGQVYATHLVAADYARSLAFYRDAFGMVQFLKAHMTEGGWHRSWKLPAGTPVDLGLLHGDTSNSALGSLEMQGYDPVHVDAAPLVPDRLDGGTCLATFTTRDIDAAFDGVRQRAEATLLSQPQVVRTAPHGGSRAFCFLGPSGERFEVAERFAA